MIINYNFLKKLNISEETIHKFINNYTMLEIPNENANITLKGYNDSILELFNIFNYLKLKNYTVNYVIYDGLAINETYTFDEVGKLKHYEFKYPNNTVKTEKFIYNDDNKLIKTINSNGVIKTYKYNDNGYLIRSTMRDNFFNLKWWTTYKYDEHNNIIEKHQSNELYSTQYKYDDNGNCIYEYDGANIMTAKYNENNKLLERKQNKTTEKYYYDDNERLIKYTYSLNNKIVNTKTYQYDSRDNITKCIFNDGVIIETYKYDDNNNKILFSNSDGWWEKYYYEDNNIIRVDFASDNKFDVDIEIN